MKSTAGREEMNLGKFADEGIEYFRWQPQQRSQIKLEVADCGRENIRCSGPVGQPKSTRVPCMRDKPKTDHHGKNSQKTAVERRCSTLCFSFPILPFNSMHFRTGLLNVWSGRKSAAVCGFDCSAGHGGGNFHGSEPESTGSRCSKGPTEGVSRINEQRGDVPCGRRRQKRDSWRRSSRGGRRERRKKARLVVIESRSGPLLFGASFCHGLRHRKAGRRRFGREAAWIEVRITHGPT